MLADCFDEPEETAMNKVEQFEKEVKKKFIDEPGQMKLLIVVDKLLTGFDAPPATYLYIDKQMRDHGLFQAICRVNRLDGDDKEYGYIVDYKDLFKIARRARSRTTRRARSTATTRRTSPGCSRTGCDKARERLEEAREAVKALCEPVEPPQDTGGLPALLLRRATPATPSSSRRTSRSGWRSTSSPPRWCAPTRTWPTRWPRPVTPTPRSRRSRARSTTTRRCARR